MDETKRMRLGGTLLAAALVAGCQAAPRQPNIVFIMADDLGIGDLGCFNAESKVPTPNLDRLATEGVRFTDAHTPSAVCTPTRYGVLTGRYCWRTRLKSGVLWSGYATALIEEDRQTVAALLQRQGYHTGVVGKWHLGFDWQTTDGEPATAKNHDQVIFTEPVTRGPNDVGFDYSWIVPASLDMEPYCWLENGSAVEPPTVQDPGSKRVWNGGGGFWRAGLRSPSFTFNGVLPTIAEKSVAFIDERAEDGEPFFLYVPFASPHTPWVPNDEFRGVSAAGTYGDFVNETDAAIGQIIEALNRHGMDDDTLVIVTSDNGSHWPVAQVEEWGHRANDIYRGQKADIHDGGHRVPFIVRWPGEVEPGTTVDRTICLTDLTATCSEIAGFDLDAATGEDSVSILPLLQGQDDLYPQGRAIVHHSLDGMFAIRRGPWKMIEGRGSGGFTAPKHVEPTGEEPVGQLYNLVDDPGETTNLYKEEVEVVAELTAMLAAIRDEGAEVTR